MHRESKRDRERLILDWNTFMMEVQTENLIVFETFAWIFFFFVNFLMI